MATQPHPGRLTAACAHAVRKTRPLPYLETLESRVYLSTSPVYRSYNGAGNNISHSSWGVAGTDLIRKSPAGYSDRISTPSLSHDLSARAISNILNNQRDPKNPTQDLNTLDQNNLSDFGYVFGQFMDHDLDLTNDGGASFPITVAANDPIGPNSLPFTRSQFDPATGTSTTNPRQQTTLVTAYLDLSQVYGSDPATAAALRWTNGTLKTSHGNMLPYLNSTYFTPSQLAAFNQAAGGEANNGGGLPSTQLFATGDVRGNENIELTALTTLFVRNHNKIAAQLLKQNPTWTDEQLYQEARKINIAEYQAIVYNEWIPAVYGSQAMPTYRGYNSSVNASISNEFSTVAFRFGHSMVSPTIAREDNNGARITSAGGDIPLSLDFFDPTLLNPSGVVDPNTGLHSTDIGAILKADADGNGQAMDLLAVNDIRNLLFGSYGAGGEDLIARDIQRGRDNGIGSYNTLRVAFGLPAVTSFSQITSNVTVQKELAQAYPGGVNTVDAFEGGSAENHVAGSDVGPLFQAIMIDQFARLRDGDRYFYLNGQLNSAETAIFNTGKTLTQIIEGNTPITNMQPNAMIFDASMIGGIFSTHGTRMSGITVNLKDSTGAIVGTYVTDAAGHFTFNQQTGINGTDTYTLVPVLPSGDRITEGPGSVLISRGYLHLTGLNFTISVDSSAAIAHAAVARPAARTHATARRKFA